MPGATEWLERMGRRPVAWWAGGMALLLVVAVAWWWRPGRGGGTTAATFSVRRGPLEISVVEGGSIQALESQEIKCEVRASYQGVKILKIVEEGYLVTDEDVRSNKVLVELDSSDIQKQLVQQEIQYQSASASLTEAQQAYEIQVNQNLSDIKAAEQKARFARMDLDKFLGEQSAASLLADLGLEGILERLTNVVAVAAPVELALAAAATNESAVVVLEAPDVVELPGRPDPEGGLREVAEATVTELARSVGGPAAEGAAPPSPAPPEPSLPRALLAPLTINFGAYTNVGRLGDGEAKQKLRKFQDDLMVARRELEQSRSTREGTHRLFEKGFVTRIDMERDDIALTNSLLKVQTAETAQGLFLAYEFPKLAEETVSKYLEGVRELDRARKAAVSKMAQADARYKSAQAQFQVQLQQRRELQQQLEKCTIRATKPGLVVYGGGEEMYWRGEEQVREGATVREMQSIITIPDMTKMSVKVRIHESYIKKVKKGQKARVTVDAFPDKLLEGEVTYVGVLPDSQNRWMNPDMKVYRTTVTIEGVHDWLKPGMTAKTEVQVDRLEDVLYVPVQAVVPVEGRQVCYVANGRGAEPRTVEVGQFNDSFIEVRDGLREGELVWLKPPPGAARGGGGPGSEGSGQEPTPTESGASGAVALRQ